MPPSLPRSLSTGLTITNPLVLYRALVSVNPPKLTSSIGVRMTFNSKMPLSYKIVLILKLRHLGQYEVCAITFILESFD